MASKAQAGANDFDATAEHYMSLGNEIATMLQGYHGPRAAVVSMMRANVAAHPEILGAYASFRPNAFDPPDSTYRGVLGSDPVGRFTPYWFWDHGKIATDRSSTAAQDYASAYYQQPEHTLANSFIEPYLYQGTLMTSYTAPILRDGHFIGVGKRRPLPGCNQRQRRPDQGVQDRLRLPGVALGHLRGRAQPEDGGPHDPVRARGSAPQPVLARIAAAIKAGRSGQVQTTDPWTGKQVVMSYASIHDGGWGYVVVAPTSEMLAGVHSLRTTLILLGALALIAIAAAVAVIATRFTRPIANIGAAAQRISEGDLDVTVTAHGEDEVAQTARSFGRMVDYLQEKATAAEAMAAGDFAVAVEARSERDVLGRAFADMRAKVAGMVREISAQTASVSASSQEMASSSDQAGRAIGEIAHAVSSVAAGAEQQVRAMDGAQQLSDQVVLASRESAQNAEQTNQAARDARRVVEEGIDAVEQVNAAMRAVEASSADATQAIQALGDKGERIGGIVETITGIASQTNLLALNAAIEAARAGEHGKGFAVVAEEVRGLAEGTQEAAATISQLIGEMQEETARAVQVVEAGADQTREGASTVDGARAAFTRIGDSVSDMTARVEQIAEAVAQIAAISERVQEEITSVAAVAEESSASTEEVSASSQETSASTEEIAASAHELAATAERLEQLVGQFRV